jgi:GTP cyclohydrolase II
MELLTPDSSNAPLRLGYSFALASFWQTVDREQLAVEAQGNVTFGRFAMPENGLPLITGKRANLFFINGEPGPRQGNAVAVMVGDESDFRNPPRNDDGTPGEELVRLHSGCLFSLAGIALTVALFDGATTVSKQTSTLKATLASEGYSEEWRKKVLMPYILDVAHDSLSAGIIEKIAASNDCDCRAQGKGALEEIYKKGGLFFDLMEQEARGHGIKNKLAIYAQQALGYTSAQACLRLKLPWDVRDYSAPAAAMIEWTDERPDIKRDFRQVTLMTNNPRKHQGLRDRGINTTLKPHIHGVTNENIAYLIDKALKGGHELSVKELKLLAAQSKDC